MHKTNAMRMLDAHKIPYEVIEYAHKKDDPVDGVHVAESLGESVDAVYKTLVTQANTKEYFVFLLPVDRELDLKKCAAAAGVKSLEMLPLKDLTKTTGYIRGGCSPIGMKKKFRTFAQKDIEDLEKVYVSAGKIGMQLHMTPENLIKAADVGLADLIR